MQRHQSFHIKYNALNSQQKDAVDSIEGPVMVVAGPGTGKTQILTLRIANILLKTQVNASNILALTFTQAAATNMRERLHAIIGHEAHHVNIFTFHAFCANIIENHPDDFWNMLGMSLIADVEKAKLLEDILAENDFRHIKPFRKPYHYVGDAIRAISELKREGVSPDEFLQIVKDERSVFDAIPDKESKRIKGSLKGIYKTKLSGIERNEELQMLYEKYQQEITKKNLYDYDDLIMGVLNKLRDDRDFALRLMEQYQYILVDEHQDSNNAQNKIIKHLTSFHENPNIFVVGDEKQAIFRFQGASVQNFRSFKDMYKNAKIITLASNYRSHQTILDSAIHMLGASDQMLKAEKVKERSLINIYEISNPLDECALVIDNIKNNLKIGTPAHEIAVITRTRGQAKTILQALAEADIPAYADLSEDVLEEPITQKLLILLKAIHNYADDRSLFDVLHLDVFSLPPFDLYKLSQAASKKRTTLAELLSDISKMESVGIKEAAKFNELFKKLGHFYMLAQNESLEVVFHEVVRDSGFLHYMLKSKNPILTTAPVRELFDQVASLDKERLWKLSHFFEYLEKLKEHHIRINVGIKLEQRNKVQVVTAHSAKGLEYEVVYIPFATDSVWGEGGKSSLFTLPASVYGSSSERADGDDEADEKRLFFVALTRAKNKIIISYSTQTIEGRQTIMSRFASSIKPELLSFVKVDSDEKAQKLAINDVHDDKKLFLEFVQSSFSSYGLSVSALNNYLECPWKYFYVNLVRVPSGKELSLMFGNAIHAALSMFYSRYKETGEKSCDYLLSAFEKSAEAQEFTKDELGDVMVRGKEILKQYFKNYEDTMSRNVRVKYRIPDARLSIDFMSASKAEGAHIDPESSSGNQEVKMTKTDVISSEVERSLVENELNNIKLTGEIDLVEFTDNSLSNVNVVDWKTGRAKSRNDILGKTKSSDGNYYRQLVFYKILLSITQPKWNIKLATLDFVEQDKSGKFHRESFDVTDEDVQDLKKTIKRVYGEIMNLSFWNEKCDNQECKWCELRESLDEKEFEGGLF